MVIEKTEIKEILNGIYIPIMLIWQYLLLYRSDAIKTLFFLLFYILYINYSEP